jgi:hypothetical protein
MEQRCGQTREQRIKKERKSADVRSSAPPRRAVRNVVKNLHESKTILNSQLKAI